MKKFYIMLCVAFSTVVFHGCGFNRNSPKINETEMSKREQKAYDIIFSVPKDDNIDKLLKVCDDYEEQNGVKIRVNEYEMKKDSLDELISMLSSKEYPAIYCTSKPEDTLSLEKLGFVYDLSRLNNETLKDKLEKANSNIKIPNNKMECYGISLKKYYENNTLGEDEDKGNDYILSMNEKSKDLDKKLSMDFLIYILENKIL